ncbi:MAG: nitroreductase family protein [Alistipes sp.]|nr:nitroreductase family protein [Alistipes sp.]
MADNYLEKRMEDYRSQPTKPTKRAANLEKLLRKNRSYRGYDPSFEVREDQLRRIVAVNTLIPSARNSQALRFRLVTRREAHKVLPHIRLGGALPHLHLPYPGTQPEAFIVVMSAIEPDHYIYIDLGISAQSMLLQATEIGLNGIMIGACDKERLQEELQLPYRPLLVIALGRGNEQIRLVEIGAEESHSYYRDEAGVHYVPKVRLEDLIIG